MRHLAQPEYGQRRLSLIATNYLGSSLWRIVGNIEGFPVAKIEVRGFVAIERASAATAEDGDLISAFVDGAIAVDSL